MFQDNHDAARFEYTVDGHVAFATYDMKGGVLTIKYVEAPPELRGTGAAGKLMEAIMSHAKEQNLKVVPICGYAVSWINRHAEFHPLLA